MWNEKKRNECKWESVWRANESVRWKSIWSANLALVRAFGHHICSLKRKFFSASTLSDRKWRERSDADKRGESKKQQKVPDAATFGRFGRHLFPFINSASTTDVAAEVLIANEHKHRDEWEEIWIFFTFCWFGDNNVVIRHCSVCFLLIYRCAAAVDASFSCSSSSRHHSPI